MKTYKIPAAGLEIQAEDLPTRDGSGEEKDVWDIIDARREMWGREKEGDLWRIPTEREFQLIMHLWLLGLLNLKFDDSNGYWVRDDGIWDMRSTMGRTWIGVAPRIRLVRDLKR